MKYGQGAKGWVQDTPCAKQDPITFCSYMIETLGTIKKIILLGNNEKKKIYVTGSSGFTKVIDCLKDAKNIVTKTFLGRNAKTAFENEFRSNMVIINEMNKRYHTLSPGFEWKDDEPIYGMIVVRNDDSRMYHLFSEGCSTQVLNIKFNQRLFNKFIKDISSILDKLQAIGYMHNDIKPDNMIFCKNSNRFKIIDWELVTSVKEPPLKFYNSGNTTFNHSIRFYLGGLPSFVAKQIQSEYGVKRPKYEWVAKLSSFKELNLIMKTSFDYLLKRHNDDKDRKTLYKTLAPHFDKWAFAQMIILLAEKHGLKYPKEKIQEYMAPFLPII